jgi:hypothetical protein
MFTSRTHLEYAHSQMDAEWTVRKDNGAVSIPGSQDPRPSLKIFRDAQKSEQDRVQKEMRAASDEISLCVFADTLFLCIKDQELEKKTIEVLERCGIRYGMHEGFLTVTKQNRETFKRVRNAIRYSVLGLPRPEKKKENREHRYMGNQPGRKSRQKSRQRHH